MTTKIGSLILDLFLLTASVITFAIMYVVCRWIHCSELSAVLVAVLWSCWPIVMAVGRQRFPAPTLKRSVWRKRQLLSP